MGKLLIASAVLMLVAVANGRADDQAPPAQTLTQSLAEPHYASSCEAVFHESDLGKAFPDAATLALCADEPVYRGGLYTPRPVCPIITTGEARAFVCGKLVEQYELYCCH
jgi:hypothetical protein